MEKRMKQMLEADVQIQGGRAAWNSAGIKGTLDGLEKKKEKALKWLKWRPDEWRAQWRETLA